MENSQFLQNMEGALWVPVLEKFKITVEKSIKLCAEVDDLVAASSKLIKYFKKSGLKTSLITSIKSYTPTRWYTVFMC